MSEGFKELLSSCKKSSFLDRFVPPTPHPPQKKEGKNPCWLLKFLYISIMTLHKQTSARIVLIFCIFKIYDKLNFYKSTNQPSDKQSQGLTGKLHLQ